MPPNKRKRKAAPSASGGKRKAEGHTGRQDGETAKQAMRDEQADRRDQATIGVKAAQALDVPEPDVLDTGYKVQSLDTMTSKFPSERQNTSLLNLTVSNMERYEVGFVKVDSIVFMPNDQIVLACLADGLKLLDQQYRQKYHFACRAERACKASDTEVLVAQGHENTIQFVEVLDTMVAKNCLHIGKSCDGVDYNNEEIYVACNAEQGEVEVRVLSRKGELKRRLGVNVERNYFNGGIFMKVNITGEKLFISDPRRNTVMCLDQESRVIYKYTDANLMSPWGLYVDDHDNVIVCGFRSHNVQIISADGKKHRTLLTETDGISFPRGISYRPSDGTLACITWTTCNYKHALAVFEIKL